MSEDDDALANDHRLVVQKWLLIANPGCRSAQACSDTVDGRVSLSAGGGKAA
jgi:hypothetical protein